MTAKFLGASGKALTYMFDRPWEKAKAQLKQGLEMVEIAPGTAHLKTADALSDLAWGLFERSDQPFPEALELFERALSIYEGEFGADHPDTAWAQACVGIALTYSGRNRPGLALLEKGCAVLKRRLGARHITTARAEFELGKSMLALKITPHPPGNSRPDMRRPASAPARRLPFNYGGAVHDVDIAINILYTDITSSSLSDGERRIDRGLAFILRSYSTLKAELGPDHPQLKRAHMFFGRLNETSSGLLFYMPVSTCISTLCCPCCIPCFIITAFASVLFRSTRHTFSRSWRLRSAIGNGIYRPSIAEKYFPLSDSDLATFSNEPAFYDAHLLSPFSRRLAQELRRPRTREESIAYLTAVLAKCDTSIGPFSPESATALYHLGTRLFTHASKCEKSAKAAAEAAIVPALKRCLDIKVRVLGLRDVECADAHFLMGQLYLTRHGLVQSVNFIFQQPDGAGLKCLSDECRAPPDQCIAPASRASAYCADMALRHFESAYKLHLELLGPDHKATRWSYTASENLFEIRYIAATCAAPCWLACCDPWTLWHKCCCGYRYRGDGGPGAWCCGQF